MTLGDASATLMTPPAHMSDGGHDRNDVQTLRRNANIVVIFGKTVAFGEAGTTEFEKSRGHLSDL